LKFFFKFLAIPQNRMIIFDEMKDNLTLFIFHLRNEEEYGFIEENGKMNLGIILLSVAFFSKIYSHESSLDSPHL
jgi:hypothetical protein